jgi:flagellum-specific ATP synthase
MAAYRDVKILLEIGAYVPGSDPLVDRAVALMPQINAFLQQGTEEYVDSTQAWIALEELVGQL